MSNWKIGDEALCMETCTWKVVFKGKSYTVDAVHVCACGSVGLSFSDANYPKFSCGGKFSGKSRCDCGAITKGIWKHEMYFTKPMQIHSTRSIKNLRVLRELASKPITIETLETQKQEA